MNVISVKGGKVHDLMPGMERHPFPACRSGAMTNSGTKYKITELPLSCTKCLWYEERRNAQQSPTSRVGQHLHENNPRVGVFTSIGESCSLDSVERFREDAVSKLGDLTEVSGADLKDADWDELYQYYLYMRGDDAPITMGRVRGDVQIGVYGSGSVVHAVDGDAPYCGKKSGGQLKIMGPAADQRSDLVLCKVCSAKVPTGEVTATTEEIQVPGLGTAVPRTVYTPIDKETKHMAPKAKGKKVDADEIMSRVHDFIDRIKAVDPSEDGAAEKVKALADSADRKVNELPVANRVNIREELRQAVASVTPTETAIEKEETDPHAYAGVSELIAIGAEKAREGVELGVQMGSVSEAVSHVILDIATRITNPATGLPDIMKERKTTKNAASEIYSKVRAQVADDDVTRLAAYNSLVKSVQNRNSDVLVDWLRAFDTSEDNTVLGELFPAAVERIDSEDISPSEAIRALYADQGVTLPEKGRKEIERDRARAKRLERVVRELEAAKDKKDVEGEDLDETELTELEDKIEKLEAKSTELREILPADALKAVKEQTPQEKAFAKVEKAEKLFTAATKGASKLSEDEKADLKAKLNELVSTIAAEAAKL